MSTHIRDWRVGELSVDASKIVNKQKKLVKKYSSGPKGVFTVCFAYLLSCIYLIFICEIIIPKFVKKFRSRLPKTGVKLKEGETVQVLRKTSDGMTLKYT
jgi:hypothetical protein